MSTATRLYTDAPVAIIVANGIEVKTLKKENCYFRLGRGMNFFEVRIASDPEDFDCETTTEFSRGGFRIARLSGIPKSMIRPTDVVEIRTSKPYVKVSMTGENFINSDGLISSTNGTVSVFSKKDGSRQTVKSNERYQEAAQMFSAVPPRTNNATHDRLEDVARLLEGSERANLLNLIAEMKKEPKQKRIEAVLVEDATSEEVLEAFKAWLKMIDVVSVVENSVSAMQSYKTYVCSDTVASQVVAAKRGQLAVDVLGSTFKCGADEIKRNYLSTVEACVRDLGPAIENLSVDNLALVSTSTLLNIVGLIDSITKPHATPGEVIPEYHAVGPCAFLKQLGDVRRLVDSMM